MSLSDNAGRSNSAEFFIVDNSDQHWKALEYLRQWCQLSSSIDIATGYFEVGALLALDGEWQKVDKFRILIGSETSRQTVEAIREARAVLDKSLAAERQNDPFLAGLEAIIEGIRSGRIEIRVYRKKKFHAKAYITHGRLDVIGSAALVGSSNFTPPGLTRNVELNVRFTGVEVRELQDWFESYWKEGETASSELLEILERHDRKYTPFEVYAKALQVLTKEVEPSAIEWEREQSKIYPLLAPYQQEAYIGLKQRASQWRGAFLTDGVGLGKTFVGLMLTEYYAVKERKNVLIMATKTGQDAVWEPELKRLLPELTGEFTNVRVLAHTDLSTQDAMDRVRRLAERVDVVIIDEGHNFRNRGSKGEDEENPRSRWWRLQEICSGKTVFHLTATPINNTLFDFVHEFELFTELDDSYFAPLGVASVRAYVSNLERTFLKKVDDSEANGEEINLADFERLLQEDKLLKALIVQNSRKYAQQSAKAAGGAEVIFPKPEMPRAVPYTYNMSYTALLGDLETAFKKTNPLFTLPMYYPLAYSQSDEVDTKLENRQKQVVGLIRTTFLKRFESSIAAFAGSCADLAMKVAQWITDNSAMNPEVQKRVTKWVQRNTDLLQEIHELFRPDFDFEEVEPGAKFSDDEFAELVEAGVVLDPNEYDLPSMFEAAFEDLTQLTNFLERAAGVGREFDDKYRQLKTLLADVKLDKMQDPQIFDPVFREQKVLVFTEYADTARYLHRRLIEDGVADVDRLDGSRKADRVQMIRRFSPHYNRVKVEDRKKLLPLRVLISTDVLSEGVNLQDASLIINYDIHWNPVRLMQRIGRVDRRLDPVRESELVAENAKVKKIRGTVRVRNFLPPDELNKILSLYNRVQKRVLLISKTLGIPGGRLLNEEDMLDDVKVFNSFLEEYMGDVSPSEALRLRFLDLVDQNPGLEELLDEMPLGIHAAKSSESAGVFMCSIEPIRTLGESDSEPHWVIEGGTVRWAIRAPSGDVQVDLGAIDRLISCEKEAPALQVLDQVQARNQLKDWQASRQVELMKDQGLPLDAPTPLTVCWMQLQ